MFTITDFGAIGDGKTVNTAAIQKAIDSCASAGGGTVVVPAGVFMTGTIWLRSHVELHIENGGVILGSPNLDDYCANDAFEQDRICKPEQWNGAHLILGVEIKDASITGPGTIDGNGDAFFDDDNMSMHKFAHGWTFGFVLAKDKERLRPGQMIYFCESEFIRVQNVNLRNSTCWSLLFHGCADVIATGLNINNPMNHGNTDGIDIDCCQRVVVSDCIICTGDDAITLRGSFSHLKNEKLPCEDISITNCVLDTNICAFRIGVGNGTIRHATISNITIRRASNGFLFQSGYWEPSTGVAISDISIDNIHAHYLYSPVKIVAGVKTTTAQIEDIFISNYNGVCDGPVAVVQGNDNTRPRHIVMRGFDFRVIDSPIPEWPEEYMTFKKADDITLNSVTIRPRVEEMPRKRAVTIEDADVNIMPNCILP